MTLNPWFGHQGVWEGFTLPKVVKTLPENMWISFFSWKIDKNDIKSLPNYQKHSKKFWSWLNLCLEFDFKVKYQKYVHWLSWLIA